MSSTEPTRPADLDRVVGDEPSDELVDDLLDATGGDEVEAEARFDRESAGRTTLRRQRGSAAEGTSAE
jgi:hypothetical protein